METHLSALDTSRKFVRLIERREDGLVEFEFAIGEPELYAEMLLPADAYEAFCETNQVIQLGPREEQADEEASELDWNLHQATHQRFR
jgi:phenol hydroxylase P0 protein